MLTWNYLDNKGAGREAGVALELGGDDELVVLNITLDGQEVALTDKESSLLGLLVLNRGRVVTNDDALQYLYGGKDEPAIKIIDVFICKIRRQFRDQEHTMFVRQSWGRGYYLLPAAGESVTPTPSGFEPSPVTSVQGLMGDLITPNSLPGPFDPRQRWTIRHKAEVVLAVEGGLVSPEEVRQMYKMRPSELDAWRAAFKQYGIKGLRAKESQRYRLAPSP